MSIGGGQGLELIPILFFFGLAGGAVAWVKGGSVWMWFLVSFCIPGLGLLCAVMHRYENRELRRQCPNCRKVVKLYDAVCVSCGEELGFPDTAIASEYSMMRGPRP